MMEYNEIIEIIAKTENITPREVDSEIRSAIKVKGLDIQPSLFINICAEIVKDDISSIV